MKRHILKLEDVNEWVANEWITFASSVGGGKGGDSQKRFERSLSGRYRVTDHGAVVYLGHDITAAVDAYNDAR